VRCCGRGIGGCCTNRLGCAGCPAKTAAGQMELDRISRRGTALGRTSSSFCLCGRKIGEITQRLEINPAWPREEGRTFGEQEINRGARSPHACGLLQNRFRSSNYWCRKLLIQSKPLGAGNEEDGLLVSFRLVGPGRSISNGCCGGKPYAPAKIDSLLIRM